MIPHRVVLQVYSDLEDVLTCELAQHLVQFSLGLDESEGFQRRIHGSVWGQVTGIHHLLLIVRKRSQLRFIRMGEVSGGGQRLAHIPIFIHIDFFAVQSETRSLRQIQWFAGSDVIRTLIYRRIQRAAMLSKMPTDNGISLLIEGERVSLWNCRYRLGSPAAASLFLDVRIVLSFADPL